MKMYLALGLFCCSGLLVVPAASKQAMFAKLRSNGFRGYEAAIVVRCVDDEGQAVPDADISTALYPDRGDNVVVRNGRTGPDGCFQIKGRTSGEVSFTLKKSGYYRTRYDYRLYDDAENDIRDGKWQPYGATNTVVLKRIRNPIAMFVVPTSRDIVIPVCNVRLPFDLEKGDWLPPYGKGIRPDFDVIFRWNGKKMNEYVGSSLELAFNKPQSGYYICPQDEYNEFKGPYHAESGHMLNTNLVLTIKINHENRKVDVLEQGAKQCFILRLRPQVANDGRVVSARYGKIYGPINFGYLSDGTGAFSCHMYLNPTPNDTNLEFDPDRNLSDDGDWRHKTHFAP